MSPKVVRKLEVFYDFHDQLSVIAQDEVLYDFHDQLSVIAQDWNIIRH